MEKYFVIALVLLSIFFFLFGYNASASLYYKKHNIKYHLWQMFPYEFNYPETFKSNRYGNIFFILSFVSTIAFYIFNYSFRQSSSIVISIASLSIAIVLTVLAVIIILMPLSYLRVHMIASSLFLVLSLAITSLNCLTAYQEFVASTQPVTKALTIVSILLSLIIVLAMLYCVLNPKATYKIYMDKTIDENGKMTYIRPRFIPMAFNEWWAIINLIISPIPLFLLFFI